MKKRFMTILNGLIPDATMQSTIENLLINSISFIKLIVCLEEEFNFQFEDEALNKNYFSTIEDIFKYVEERSKNNC